MNLFDLARENAVAISQLGMRALDEAKRAGVPIYYMEARFGDHVIREFPDGSRECIVDELSGASVSIPPRG